MNQRIADMVTTWSLGREVSRESDKFQIVSYGILLMIETIYKVIILMILGEIIGAFPETIAFLIGFSGLRKNAGGIHMRTSAGCMLSVMFLWIITILCSRVHILSWIYVVLFFVTVVLVAIYAPCDTINNPIRDVKIRKKKKIYALMYMIILSTFAYYIGYLGFTPIQNSLVVAMALEGVTIIHKRKELQA